MTPLGANLKHLYQRRGLWLFYALMVLMGVTTVSTMLFTMHKAGDKGRGIFAFPLLAVFCAASFMASHVADIMASPLSFCLPDHQKAARRFLAIVGAVVSVLSAMVFIAYPGQDWPVRLTAVAAACCTNLACFWVATLAVMPRTAGGFPVGAKFIIWAWLLVLVGLYYGLHTALVDAIIAGRLWLFGACLLVVVMAWSRWGDRDLARRFCGTPRMAGFDIGDVERVRRMSQMRWAAKGTKVGAAARLTEQFFLSRLSGHRALGAARAIWGGLYATFGAIGSTGPAWILVCVFLMAVFFGCFGGQWSWFVFVFASIMAGTWIQHPVYSTIPIPQGRRERFLVGIGASLTGCILAAIVLGAAVLITHLLVPIGPVIPSKGPLKGEVLRFQAMQPWGLWIPWAVLPAVQVVRLAWPRRWFMAIVVCYGLAPVVTLNAGSPDLMYLWTLPVVAGMIITSWCVSLAVLHRVCFTRDLVIQ